MQLEISGILVFNTKRWLFSAPFENWNACTYPQRGNVIVEAPIPSLLVSNLRHIRGNCNRFCICFINVWEKFLLYLNILLIFLFFPHSLATKPSLELFRVICMPEGCSCTCNHMFHFTRLVWERSSVAWLNYMGLKITSQSSQNKLIFLF